jgi:sigma-54 dependent transcriptional regulator, acetoin dehydrogenase operon transcriptional activator AcoR
LKKFSNENDKLFQEISSSSLDALCSYAWPGNVRELQNCIQQCVVLNQGEVLEVEMLPKAVCAFATGISVGGVKPDNSNIPGDAIIPFENLEKDAIENALRIIKGSVPKASTALHLSQATIYRKIREYNLMIKKFKD